MFFISVFLLSPRSRDEVQLIGNDGVFPGLLLSSVCLPLVGAKEGGRDLFDDPSYVNVDKPRPPVASNGNAHRDAFDMSMCVLQLFLWVFFLCDGRAEGTSDQGADTD